jgi:cellulose synthase/poly-beta-1,6-N-acetylglucosamine synthase-like glycosyltransferase
VVPKLSKRCSTAERGSHHPTPHGNVPDDRVSVVVPAFNAAAHLGGCLKALCKQTWPPDRYEVIVVDDGSSDDTARIARAFDVEYAFQNNRGPAAARNRGAQLATGEFLLFTDSDCIPEEDWIEAMVAPFSDPKVMGVKGAYRNAKSGLWPRFVQTEFEERYSLLLRQESIDMVDTYSAAFRREVFLAVGGFDTSFPSANNEDTELSYRLARRDHKMVYQPRARVWNADPPDSLRRYFRLKFWRGYWRTAVYYRYPGKMLRDSYTPQSLKLQMALVLLCVTAPFLAPLSAMAAACVLGASLAAFLVACASFVTRAFPEDRLVAVISPFFLFVRALALGSGVAFNLLERTLLGRDRSRVQG